MKQDTPKDSEVGRARARVGQVLKGKWRLDALLGIGGMAVVYAATHRNGNRVAVKVLKAELARSADVKARFLREGYLADAVGHPGAVSVIDDDVADDGAVFLVMELLEGETVERRWDRMGRRLPLVEVLSIADRLLDVLASAHAKEIVHRDIKPENLFLTRRGELKILDFGIARVRELSPRPNATQDGATMGTPQFMAPEQARGRWDDVDARTDLWAVGATMFALLCGRLVHEADTVNEQLLSAMTNAAPHVASLAPEVPSEVADVIDRALAYRSEDRWRDAQAMKSAMRRAYPASGGDGQSSPTLPSAPPYTLPALPVVSRAPVVVGALAAALGVLIGITAFAHRPVAWPTRAAAGPLADAVVVALPPADDPTLTHPSDDALRGEAGTGAATAPYDAGGSSALAASSSRVAPRASSELLPAESPEQPDDPDALPARSSPGLLDRRH